MEELPSCSEKKDSEDNNETFVTCVDTDDLEQAKGLAGTTKNIESEKTQNSPSLGLGTPCSEKIVSTATVAAGETAFKVASKADETNSDNLGQSAVVSNQCVDVTLAQESLDSFRSAVTSPVVQTLESSSMTEYDTPNTSVSSKSSLVPESQVKVSVGGTSPCKALISLVGYGESDSDDDMEADAEVEEVQQAFSNENEKDDAEIVTVPTTSSCVIAQGSAATSLDNPEKASVIDLTTDNRHFTVDLGSGTDDSESDSDSSSSSSSSSSSTVPLSSSSEESSDDEIVLVRQTTKDAHQTGEKPNKEGLSHKKKRNTLLTPGEISIEDLPPIENLKITVPEDKIRVIGYVFNIVEQQVVVQGHHGIPPIDLDSVLFLDNGKKVLGVVFDVFGQVQEPLYVVRFNSSEHVKELGINKGEPVFYAPETEHASFVVIDDLMRMKGSDASGLTGNEVLPCELTDFSDDEEEAKVKGVVKQSKFQSSTGEFQPSRKRSRNMGGREKGAGKDRPCRGGLPNPFSGQGMKSGPRFHSGPRPFMKQRFPGNSGGGPPYMQGPRFDDYGCRPVAPFPNQFEMNGNMNYDVNSSQYHGSPSPGPSINYHPNSPRPWVQQIPNHQFSCHTSFSNQRPGFPPVNDGSMPHPVHTTPPPPPCQIAFSPRPPTPTSVGEHPNMGPPVTSGPPPRFHSYPVPGTPGPSPGSSGFQNLGSPVPPPSPHHHVNHQNMAPQTYSSFPPQRPPHPVNEFPDMMPPPQPHIDISSPPPPMSPAMNGGWMPPRNAPSYPPNSFAPPPPPPPPTPPPHQYPPYAVPPPFPKFS
ncbi:H/ACA ribonucleoprotein complex non-core subunit NAF1-like [Macrobrachium nipponense]|uniref:H/ACA ribonucleoprotein complex non-core subunit NAF1-like n=1 Tax=Macrobrachium nipponense TaxID=159736 RepID=UPI0030C7D368